MMFGSSTNFLFIEASFYRVFLHVSVILSTGEGGVWQTPHQADTPPGRQTPPWQVDIPQRRRLQQTVRILLECILVKNHFAPPIIDFNFNYGYLKNTLRVILQTFVLNLNEN